VAAKEGIDMTYDPQKAFQLLSIVEKAAGYPKLKGLLDLAGDELEQMAIEAAAEHAKIKADRDAKAAEEAAAAKAVIDEQNAKDAEQAKALEERQKASQPVAPQPAPQTAAIKVTPAVKETTDA
jgi:hypothetical protein